MVMVYRYKSVGTTAFNVDLGSSAVRLGSIQGFSEKAEHVAVGSSSIVIDNPSGTVGHSSDQIIGLQLFTVDETDAPAGNQRLFTGYIGARDYDDDLSPTNSVSQTGAGNIITATLFDLNAILGFRVLPRSDTTANRPAETVGARLTWILGSAYLSGLVADNGLVVYPSSIGMDACDYRGQRPSNVINDCELASSYFAFVYPDETQTVIASLFFDDANTSTAYTTTLRLTNVLSDVDNVTTFAVDKGFKLSRVPDDVGSGVFLPFQNSAIYERRAATEDTYGRRDLIAPNSNVKTAAKATQIADDFLWDHHTEEDRFTGTFRVPAQYVNKLRAGQRLQVKFRNRPGYTSWTWVRCLSRAPGQRDPTADSYTVAVELSPQEAAPAAARIVQSAFGRFGDAGGSLSLPNPVTIGSVLVWAMSDRGSTSPSAPNIVPGLPTVGGTGAWTRFNGATLSSSQVDGAAMYYKTATATDQVAFNGASQIVCGIWELAGADPASATVVYVDQGTSGPTYSLGNLTSVGTDQVALALIIFGDSDWPWGSPGYSWATPLPNPSFAAGWTLRISLWAFDSFVGPWYKVEHPWASMADAVGTGATLAAAVTPGLSSKNYGGIAIKIPAI